MKRLYTIPTFAIAILIIFFVGCKKLTDVVPPINRITSSQAFSNDESATEVINGIYSVASGSSNLLSGSTTIFAGLYADELGYTGSTPGITQFHTNTISSDNTTIRENFWGSAYNLMYSINMSLEQLSNNKRLSETINNQLTGECKFLRALLYFELIQFFGDVPLVTSSDHTINEVMPRTDRILIKQKILEDLKSAKDLLLPTYPTVEKIRANKWAAVALLARFYLYEGDWWNAEREATELINTGIYHLESRADRVFLANSTEAIFQIRPVQKNYNTMEGNMLIPLGNAKPSYTLTPSLAGAFEPNDKRKTAWVTSSKPIGGVVYQYPFKYKQRSNFSDFKLSEYTTVFRLAELYLIRAESRAALNLLPGAISDLDSIRYRAGLPLIAITNPNISAVDLLNAIQKERRIELFAEWGHRWFDLKRTGKANETLAFKSKWTESDTLWPIPSSQIGLNPALTQNSGYH